MANDRFTNEERIAFYNAIAYLDPDMTYVIYNKDLDTLSYTKNIICYETISGNYIMSPKIRTSNKETN